MNSKAAFFSGLLVFQTALTYQTLSAGSAAAKEETVAFPKVSLALKDEATPAFKAYRTKLLASLKNNDTKSLLALIDPNLKFSFGKEEGLSAFKKKWDLDKGTKKIAEALLPVLELGGVGDNKHFCAPYLFCTDDAIPEEIRSERYLYSVAIGASVPVYSKPSATSGKIDSLNYHVVKVGDCDTKDWCDITLWDKRVVYGRKADFRSFLDYRALFEFKHGAWKMTAFVAGD